MKIKFMNFIVVLGLLLLSAGCGSVKPEVSQDELFKKYVSVKDFYTALEAAKKDKIDFFAPDGFKQATKLYREAFKFAKNGGEEKSAILVQEGQIVLSKAIESAQDARELLKEIIELRNKAIDLGVTIKYKDRFNDADRMFIKANSLIEKGELDDTLKYFKKLSYAYNSIRSDILKDTLYLMVKDSAMMAKENKAKEFAPKTMAIAELQLHKALDIVTQDPNKMSEGKKHIESSIHNYKKANQITKMVQHFKGENYNEEDYILWYWEQLETINKHLGDTLDFTKNNYQNTENINRATDALIQELQNARTIIKEQQQRYDALNKKYNEQVLALSLKKQKKTMKYKTKEDRYSFINSLFDLKTEARIYKEGKNIIISAFGINFTKNQNEILKKDYPILIKIISAIELYPNAKVGVYAHTDSIGEANVNKELSMKRAKNITKFLVEIGKIDPKKIITKGFGESEPIATNMIQAGRMQNSRIDIHIISAK